MLPSSVHDKPAIASTKSKISTIRQNTFVQRGEFLVLSFLGSFFGVALVATMSRAELFQRDGRNAPIVIGRSVQTAFLRLKADDIILSRLVRNNSFGAEAVLLYAAPTSPLAQARRSLHHLHL